MQKASKAQTILETFQRSAHTPRCVENARFEIDKLIFVNFLPRISRWDYRVTTIGDKIPITRLESSPPFAVVNGRKVYVISTTTPPSAKNQVDDHAFRISIQKWNEQLRPRIASYALNELRLERYSPMLADNRIV